VESRQALVAACTDTWTPDRSRAWLDALAKARRLEGALDKLRRLLHLRLGAHEPEYFWVRARLACPLQLHAVVDKDVRAVYTDVKKTKEISGAAEQLQEMEGWGRRMAQALEHYLTQLGYNAVMQFGKKTSAAEGGGQQPAAAAAAAGGGGGGRGGAAAAAAAAAAAPRQYWCWHLRLNPGAGRKHATLDYEVEVQGGAGPRPQAVLVQPAAHPGYNNAGEVRLTTQGASIGELLVVLIVAIPITLLLAQARRSNVWHSGDVGAQEKAQPRSEELQRWVQVLDQHPPEQAPTARTAAGFLWLTKVGADAEESGMFGAFPGVGFGPAPAPAPAPGIPQQ
jgi:hypothetical protein